MISLYKHKHSRVTYRIRPILYNSINTQPAVVIYNYPAYRFRSNMTSTTPQYSDELLQHSIGTHSGTFHADESLACYMLVNYTTQYKAYNIVRSRDNNILNKCSILVDVGAVYDPATNRYDHHQHTFNVTFNDQHTVTKLSSAGLIYKHFGHEIIKNIIHEYNQQNNKVDDTKLDNNTIELLYQHVYDNFIESMDAIDNGVNQYDTSVKPKYVNKTDLSHRVGYLLPFWNESYNDDDLYNRFKQAMLLTGNEFKQYVLHTYNSWLPARQIVEQCFKQRYDIHQSGQILLLSQYTVWKAHVFDIEKEYNSTGQIKLVLYSDSSNTWRIQAMPVDNYSFNNRCPLPTQWRGYRDNELSNISGIQDCIFVHATGFIGGNKTREGVIQMAIKTLELNDMINNKTQNEEKKQRID